MLGLGFIWFGWSRTILAGIECGFVEPSPAELGWAWLGWLMTPLLVLLLGEAGGQPPLLVSQVEDGGAQPQLRNLAPNKLPTERE